MKKKSIFIVITIALLFISGCTDFSDKKELQESPEKILFSQENDQEYYKGIIHVKFKDSINVDTKSNAISEVNKLKQKGVILRENPNIEKVFMSKPGTKNFDKKKKFGLHRWVEVEIPLDSDPVIEAKRWELLEEIEYAIPLQIPKMILIPDDPLFPQQWHHENTGQSGGTPGADINSIEAWDAEGENIIRIGVPDTSVEWFHEDLVDNLWQNLGEDADRDGTVLEWSEVDGRYVFDPDDVNGIDDDENGYIDDFIGWDHANGDNDPSDLTDLSNLGRHHGTLTSGIIFSEINNGLGPAGICSKCELISFNTYHKSKVQAIEYATDNGARIISLSFKHVFLDQEYLDAFNHATDQDVLLVIGAGNDDSPKANGFCEHNKVLCVSATEHNNKLVSFSDYGWRTDVAAPGWNIYTTMAGNTYIQESGTSFSAPLVAGIAGMILSKNPLLSSEEVYSILQSSVDPLVTPSVYAGNGIIDAEKALQNAENTIDYGSFPVAIIEKETTYPRAGNTLDIYGVANGGDFLKYEIYYGLGIYPETWAFAGESSEMEDSGLLYQLNLVDLPVGEYLIKLVTTDAFGQEAIDTFPFVRGLLNAPNWPKEFPIPVSPTLGDLDGDGAYEILISSGEFLSLYDYGGNLIGSYDYSEMGGSTTEKPLIGDVDNEGNKEIVTYTYSHITILRDDLTHMPNWPQQFPNMVASQPVLSDINENGNQELIFLTYLDNQLHILDYEGNNLPGWPKPLEDEPGYEIYLAVANLDNYENKEIIIPHSNYLEVFDDEGNSLPGWPIILQEDFYQNPILADIDGDRFAEIIILTDSKKIYAFNYDGSIVDGWPQNAYEWSPIPLNNYYLSIGNLDSDELPEIIAIEEGDDTSNPYAFGYRSVGKIFVFNGDGSLVSGWPQTKEAAFSSLAITGDIDGDNELEVLVDGGKFGGFLYAFNQDGSTVNGWPQHINDYIPPIIKDIDGDNKIEILVGGSVVNLWRTESTDTEIRDWPMERYDNKNTLNYHSSEVCGDLVCNPGENCLSCPGDCPICDSCIYLDQKSCSSDHSCTWCEGCQNTKSNIYGKDICVDVGECDYKCNSDFCSAQCSEAEPTTTPVCLDSYTLEEETITCNDLCVLEEEVIVTDCSEDELICFNDVCIEEIDCSSYNGGVPLDCIISGEGQCEPCSECNGKKSNGLGGYECVKITTCSYSCVAGSCGAECNSDDPSSETRTCIGNTENITTLICKGDSCILESSNEVLTDCGVGQCIEGSGCDLDSYELNLYEGTWNFVSIPLSNLVDNNINKFDSDIVLSYGGSSWEMNYKEIINELSTIETNKGYIVYSDSDKTITFNGELIDTYVYPLEEDTWNLVGSTIDGYDFEGNQIFNSITSITSEDVVIGTAYWVYTGTEPQFAPPTLNFWENLLKLLGIN
ncbi:S8 family serine peptidase [archaeon]|nr:S8 family serine peptidase [archaeon]